MTPRALVVLLLLLLPAGLHAAANDPDTLSFELPSKGWFVGWGGAPKETQFIDSTTVHGGRYAARLERKANSQFSESTALNSLRVTFGGARIELRGWLKTRDVNGFVGLWMREDAKDQFNLQMHNMMRVSGTNDWKEYRIELPIDPRADSIWFGAHIVGTGTVWVDDLQFFVDGKPLAEAPARVRVEDTVQKDHEFDHGSRVDVTGVSNVQVKNLALLAKVWGFTKYHHPKIVAGNVSWDYELFRVLPAVLAAKNSREAQQAMTDWIEQLGASSECTACATPPDSIQSTLDIGWIRDEKRLGKTLARQLQAIHKNRPIASKQYFVSFTEDGNPDFTKERDYTIAADPDAGYRLLALFRFWNIIEYWYPDRALIDEKWDNVLTEFIPRFVAAADRRAYILTIKLLATRIDDGHAVVSESWALVPPVGEGQLPVSLRRVEGKFVVHAYTDSLPRAKDDLQIGDVLVAIGGRSVDSLATAVAPYYSASNEPSRTRNIAFNLTNGPVGPCHVRVKRDGRALDVVTSRQVVDEMKLYRASLHDLPGPTFQKLSDDVAYVKLSSVKADDATSYIEQAAGTKCLLIDIRNYPSDFMPFVLGGHLVDKPAPFACFTTGDATNPGTFTWTRPTIVLPIAPRYPGKVAVLVDEAAQSSSEYTAMGFRATGALVVGSTTAGADGNISRIPLPGGIRAVMSGIGVFYPDHSPTQQIGIVPDLVVHPTIKGIRDGHDEVAEAAIKRLIGVDLRIPYR